MDLVHQHVALFLMSQARSSPPKSQYLVMLYKSWEFPEKGLRNLPKARYLVRRFMTMKTAAAATTAAAAIPIIMYVMLKPSVTIGVKLTSGVRFVV